MLGKFPVGKIHITEKKRNLKKQTVQETKTLWAAIAKINSVKALKETGEELSLNVEQKTKIIEKRKYRG